MSSLALPKFNFTVLVSFVGSDSNLSLIANSLKLISFLSALHFFLSLMLSSLTNVSKCGCLLCLSWMEFHLQIPFINFGKFSIVVS